MNRQENPETSNRFSKFRSQISAWAWQQMSGYRPIRVREAKIVRDAVHGFLRIYPHEVAFVDSPVVQRLRYIHQTALAHLVYPTMRHTRFDHTLGMAYVAELMIRSLQQKHPREISERDVQIIRLSALLHDLGHAVFSHLSEGVIDEWFGALFDSIRRESVDGVPNFFEEASSGEIISYLIATSAPVTAFLAERFDEYREAGCRLQAEDVAAAAGLVVGRVATPERRQFMPDIINGSFDADKLDYIQRDCHFSGIRAEVDVSRIVQGLDRVRRRDWDASLLTHISVAPQLEQLLMSKMLLFTSVYHHHKVRALESMVLAIFGDARTHAAALKRRGLRFRDPVDFLNLSEDEFWVWGLSEPSIRHRVRSIRQRKLLKRALVINRHTVTEQSWPRLTSLRSKLPTLDARLAGAQAILKLVPKRYRAPGDLWLDLPKAPDIDEEATQCLVSYSPDVEPVSLADTFPTNDWIETYVANKLTYHVFYGDDMEHRKRAAAAAEQYLRDIHRIATKAEARRFAHLD